MNDVDAISAAFPRSAEGWPMCAHCGGRRPGYYMLCVDCWSALSAFVQIELIRASTRAEKARLILDTRAQLP